MYVMTDVPKDILDKIDIEINKTGLSPVNNELAGNLKHEFLIQDARVIIHPFLIEMVKEHRKRYPEYFRRMHSLIDHKEVELMLFKMWVNFQKKHEFNPMHIHDGLFSFVIWHKVPYKMEDEAKVFPDMKEKDRRNGFFSFFFTHADGKIMQEPIPVDNSYEGKIALFPANLNHCVYPFYTSDDYRVSISGNLGFKL